VLYGANAGNNALIWRRNRMKQALKGLKPGKCRTIKVKGGRKMRFCNIGGKLKLKKLSYKGR